MYKHISYVTLDLDNLHAFLLAQGSRRFKLLEITMATIDSQVLRAMSAISSWAECSNTNDCTIDRLATPLNDTTSAHAFLDAAILC